MKNEKLFLDAVNLQENDVFYAKVTERILWAQNYGCTKYNDKICYNYTLYYTAYFCPFNGIRA